MNKTQLKVLAGVLAIFLLGGIIGGLGAGIYLRHRVEQFARKAPKDHKEILMERLSRELGLTESQKPDVERIVSTTEIEIRQLLQESRIKFTEITARRNAEMKAILTLDQYHKLENMEQRIRARWEKNPPPPPPPFPDGPPPSQKEEPGERDASERPPEQQTP